MTQWGSSPFSSIFCHPYSSIWWSYKLLLNTSNDPSHHESRRCLVLTLRLRRALAEDSEGLRLAMNRSSNEMWRFPGTGVPPVIHLFFITAFEDLPFWETSVRESSQQGSPNLLAIGQDEIPALGLVEPWILLPKLDPLPSRWYPARWQWEIHQHMTSLIFPWKKNSSGISHCLVWSPLNHHWLSTSHDGSVCMVDWC